MKEPSFAPSSRPAFLDRLSTFRDVTLWSPKPEIINEVAWAKRGWRLVGAERVQCVSCGAERVILIRSPPEKAVRPDERSHSSEAPDESFDELALGDDAPIVKAYVSLLTDAHDPSCLWRMFACDEGIQHITLSLPQRTISELKERTMGLLRALEGPLMLGAPVLDFDPTVSSIRRLLELSQQDVVEERVLGLAFMLALFGWRAFEGVGDCISCGSCFRRVGLWSYRGEGKWSCDAEEEGETAGPVLQVLAEHRVWCPWVCKDAQSPVRAGRGGKREVAWEGVVRQVGRKMLKLAENED